MGDGHSRSSDPRLLAVLEPPLELETDLRHPKGRATPERRAQQLCGVANALLLLGSGRGLLLDAVLRAALLAAVDAEAVKRATYNVVTHTGEIADASTAHEHDGVLLQIVAFATDVRRDFLAVGEANAANLAERGVRLLRRNSADLQANAALLRACHEVLHLRLGGLDNAGLTDELIDRGHR